jgi:UDP-3-O-[3-hydroxymyristoyl] glucosamine N-acyltransferase
VDPGAAIGPYAVVRAGALVEAAVIGPYAYVAEGAKVGAGSVLEARVTLYRHTQIGANCRIGAHSVLGEIGFGFQDGKRLAHTGCVVLEDGVEIGAGCIVQRSLVGDTRIGESSKLGDMINVGHNVHIGRGVVMVGFGGIGGSSIIEDQVLIGGDCIFSDHVHVGKGAKIMAGSRISKAIPAGETWAGGIPAEPVRKHWRRLALLDWLVGVEKRLKGLFSQSA